MIVAPPGSPPALNDIVRQINEELTARDNPKGPVRLPAFDVADLPSASRFRSGVARLSTGEIVSSDGAVWRYADGSAV